MAGLPHHGRGIIDGALDLDVEDPFHLHGDAVVEFILIRGKDDPVRIFFCDPEGAQHIHVGALYLHDGMRHGTKDGVPGPSMAKDDFIAVLQAFPRLLRAGLEINQIIMDLVRAAHHGLFTFLNDFIGMQ